MEFQKRVSVIVPVYNAKAYLEECLNSLVGQTIKKSEMQVVLVNDGSTDESEEICKKFCEKYDFFDYYYIENSGVSVARNFGIKKSVGKYIMYLDSDDQLTSASVESIVDFFDGVYDEVDLVTYYIQPYKDGALLNPHARYHKLLTHTGVFDLEKNPYVIQTTMNICVKNMGENNELFNEKMTSQEDQEYINRILMDKLMIGYCAQACYMYNRDNESSCVSTKFHAYYLFESSLRYFENLFSLFEDKVPKYFQAVFFHDLRWKLTNKILFPFHYEGAEFENAMNRIKKLLERVDTNIIVKNPSINKKHIHFWLNLKPNVHPTIYVNNEAADVVADGKTIERNKRISLRIIKIVPLDDGRLRIRCECAMGIYDYMPRPPKFYVVENGEEKKELSLYRSSYSYVATNIMTNNVYGFEYSLDPEKISKISFKAVVDSYEFDVRVNFMGMAVFRHKIRFYSYARGGYIISYYNDSLLFEKKTREEIAEFEKAQALNFNKETYVYNLKLEAIDYRLAHRVWLYSDLQSVLKDNAYYQFQNDFKHKDGIERYYVYTKPYEEIEHLFTDEQKEYLVEFGSYKHQLIYLSSEIIFTSFFG
ncbi:MAG: glycosyltransferase family 2 protein, partial [Clostridia bacterium]|nr:glycosyltransferase family 2 protein [Clostridia bacterium]